MTLEQANQLVNIYNNLLLVNTRGEDTMIMGECLLALKALMSQIKVEKKEEKDNG